MKKGQRVGYSRQPVFKKRRRVTLLVLVLFLTLVAGGLLFLNNAGRTGSEQLEPIMTPTVEQEAPEPIVEDPVADEGATEEAEEEAMAIPDDPTLYLTVPKLGIYGHTVRNDDSEAALDLGAIKVPGTDFPWQKGDTNTYIACHRLGWPGTESYNQCLNLPSIQEGDEIILGDANGAVYDYRVSETLTVGPNDSWVMKPIADEDMVSLQTCIEAPGDFLTLGPNWSARFVVRANRVA
jgi:sortase A